MYTKRNLQKELHIKKSRQRKPYKETDKKNPKYWNFDKWIFVKKFISTKKSGQRNAYRNLGQESYKKTSIWRI